MSDHAVLRLSGRGRAVRLGVAALVLGLVSYGSLRGHDPMFPFGPMSQYARYVSPDGTVQSTTVWADTTAGTHVRVRLDAHGVGVKRADVEAQLPRILVHPELLRTIATAQRRLHPDAPQFVKLYVVRATTHLRDRVPAYRTVETLVTWDVR